VSDTEKNVSLIVNKLSGGYSIRTFEETYYVDAVNKVSFYVKNNEILGIAGESGCGKSTLLKLIDGFIKYPLIVKNGEILLQPGKDKPVNILSLDSNDKRKKVWWKLMSYIPQNSMNVLNPTLKVKDHFIEVITTHMNVNRDVAYKIASEHITIMGLSKDVLTAYPHQLSGGMRQRVVIALAFLMKPRVILADEPTTALDVVVQRGILQILVENHRKLENSLIVVTHDMGIHAMITDRLLTMYAGKLVEIGNTEAVFEDPLHPYTKLLISSLPRLGEKTMRKGIHGMPPDLKSPPPGCRFHPRCPYAMEICKKEEPPILEVGKERFVACWLFEKEVKG